MDNGVAAEPRPSATVVVARPGAEGAEVLLLRRNPELAHMPDIWVFPGGKVDPVDRGVDMQARARQAAIRELNEEASLALSQDDLWDFSHWLTPLGLKRRFATWFYLAVVPPTTAVAVDGSEIVEHQWLCPREALNRHSAGELETSPPTLVTLHDVAQHSIDTKLDPLIESVQRRAPPYFFPKVYSLEDGMCFLYPGDAGYEVDDPDFQGPRHRSELKKGKFSYERSFQWPERNTESSDIIG